MKKILFLLFCVLTPIISGCNKSDSKAEDSLAGTTWTATYGSDTPIVLDFVSSTNVEFFPSDQFGNVKGTVSSGTYKKNGNNIEFNLVGKLDWLNSAVYTTGSISNNRMTVKWYYEGYPDNPLTEVFIKK